MTEERNLKRLASLQKEKILNHVGQCSSLPPTKRGGQSIKALRDFRPRASDLSENTKNGNTSKSTQRRTRGGLTEQPGPTFQIVTRPETGKLTGADRSWKFNDIGNGRPN
ncbi:uncharacterized protein LACBIDRAFT_331391 [Laccaria bicolor S238N-H82]|uniref:Predicted protein n=1 Tax=Laccaria bicolor (strain S238N-H82 / ATCC MYA-4686) TaxID=486041 RepID=B0DPC3_LACBS|nr:uncharacterized protein LACBIDRAFT_331391 [Laccaria bicolor S238N-H82]EDR03655.1 predicted protein [Laccaria bicolor S238N-H82]|eukprot:XP_001885803.1 predicted protein [Laccaria bicolor S238N-H82]